MLTDIFHLQMMTVEADPSWKGGHVHEVQYTTVFSRFGVSCLAIVCLVYSWFTYKIILEY